MGRGSYPVPQSTTQGGSEPAMLGREALGPRLRPSLRPGAQCPEAGSPPAPLLPRIRREPKGAAVA